MVPRLAGRFGMVIHDGSGIAGEFVAWLTLSTIHSRHEKVGIIQVGSLSEARQEHKLCEWQR